MRFSLRLWLIWYILTKPKLELRFNKSDAQTVSAKPLQELIMALIDDINALGTAITNALAAKDAEAAANVTALATANAQIATLTAELSTAETAVQALTAKLTPTT